MAECAIVRHFFGERVWPTRLFPCDVRHDPRAGVPICEPSPRYHRPGVAGYAQDGLPSNSVRILWKQLRDPSLSHWPTFRSKSHMAQMGLALRLRGPRQRFRQDPRPPLRALPSPLALKRICSSTGLCSSPKPRPFRTRRNRSLPPGIHPRLRILPSFPLSWLPRCLWTRRRF